MKLHSEISVARLVLYISILFSISDNNSEEQDSLKVRETTILQIDSTDQLPMTNALPRTNVPRKTTTQMNQYTIKNKECTYGRK